MQNQPSKQTVLAMARDWYALEISPERAAELAGEQHRLARSVEEAARGLDFDTPAASHVTALVPSSDV